MNHIWVPVSLKPSMFKPFSLQWSCRGIVFWIPKSISKPAPQLRISVLLLYLADQMGRTGHNWIPSLKPSSNDELKTARRSWIWWKDRSLTFWSEIPPSPLLWSFCTTFDNMVELFLKRNMTRVCGPMGTLIPTLYEKVKCRLWNRMLETAWDTKQIRCFEYTE